MSSIRVSTALQAPRYLSVDSFLERTLVFVLRILISSFSAKVYVNVDSTLLSCMSKVHKIIKPLQHKQEIISVKGSNEGIVKDSRETGFESWALDTLDGTGLESNNQDFVRHDESAEAQTDGEGEHSIQLIMFHRFNYIACLKSVSDDLKIVQIRGATYTQHENKTSGYQTECSNYFSWRACREVRGRWFEI